MENLIQKLIPRQEQKDFRQFVFTLQSKGEKYLLRNDITLELERYCEKHKKTRRFRTDSATARLFRKVPEMMFMEDTVLVMHRFSVARYAYYRLNANADYMEPISINEYLDYKDAFVMGDTHGAHKHSLEIDMLPFHDYTPLQRQAENIGNGINFLNRHLTSALFRDHRQWGAKLYEFISLHHLNGQQLLVNPDLLTDLDQLLERLEKTLAWLTKKPAKTPFAKLEKQLKKDGFVEGWGATAGRIAETMGLLKELFHEPSSPRVEEFISRIPMIRKIAILSPHGWFGQENVLGKPDTGGQVIYILDQVRALERYLQKEFELAGIPAEPKIIVVTRLIPNAEGTACDRRLEKIHNTKNGWILRVPFVDAQDRVLRDWVSRFDIWPYLDRFTGDVENELTAEFAGRPDLIIGNYSDGNLVATLLSDRMNVIQCTIAHALEKTKYLFSDLYWKDMEADYHFSCQFTADMIAMNKADFIIASTHQEISGTETGIGQYESYQAFTMPGLYQVVGGINLFNPKFNVVPPGVDENNYFPFHRHEDRIPDKTRQWEKRLFHDKLPDVFGTLDDPEKPPIFTMARLDRIKNIAGLVEAFGRSKKLREAANLVFAAGSISVENSKDREEQQEIKKLHGLIEELDLLGHVRWLPSVNKADTGEVYRIMADRRGIFVQPALFEAFGLTILEAMQTGLPTFGPVFGGPSEIIIDGISGFLMNTSRPELLAPVIENFFQQCAKDPDHWTRISEGGMARVKEAFTWHLYSKRLMGLTKLYGFWRYAESRAGMEKLDHYCDLLYHLLLKPRAEAMLTGPA